MPGLFRVAYSQSRRPSDPDAPWAKKKNKHGRDHWWFGYKVHLVVDATHEIPLHVEVTPANVSDSQSLIPVLRHAAWTVTPTHVLADAGYDATHNYACIRNELKANPIIKLNKRGAKEDDRPRHRSKGQILAYGLRKFAGIDMTEESEPTFDERIQQAVREVVEEAKYDLMFNETHPLADKVTYLEPLIVEQRMMTMWVRLRFTLERLVDMFPGPAESHRLKMAHEALNQERNWFWGAVRDSETPIKVFQEWAERLEKQLSRFQADSLLDRTELIVPRGNPNPMPDSLSQ